MKRRYIFITGGDGYIGRRLLQYITEEPNNFVFSVSREHALPRFDTKRVFVVRSDLNDTRKYENELFKAEYVIWLAANRKHFNKYQMLYNDNVLPLEKALPMLKRSVNLKKFIYISSISAVDNTLGSRTSVSIQSEPRPVTSYGLTKWLGEKCVRESGVPFIILRLPFMYGSGYRPYSHLWLWRQLADSRLFGRLQFPGKLSLLHINDFSEIVMAIIKEESKIADGTEYILCDGVRHKINTIIDFVGQMYGNGMPRKKIKVSSSIGQLLDILPVASISYWSKALTDEWYFTAVSAEEEFLREYRFMGLYEGLVETYI